MNPPNSRLFHSFHGPLSSSTSQKRPAAAITDDDESPTTVHTSFKRLRLNHSESCHGNNHVHAQEMLPFDVSKQQQQPISAYSAMTTSIPLHPTSQQPAGQPTGGGWQSEVRMSTGNHPQTQRSRISNNGSGDAVVNYKSFNNFLGSLHQQRRQRGQQKSTHSATSNEWPQAAPQQPFSASLPTSDAHGQSARGFPESSGRHFRQGSKVHLHTDSKLM